MEGSDTSQYGNVSGWEFPQFDESTSAVVRISASGRFIEDVDLSLDDVQVLHGASSYFEGVNLSALGSDRTRFVYDVGAPVDEDITIEMLSFDHNGQQLFP